MIAGGGTVASPSVRVHRSRALKFAVRLPRPQIAIALFSARTVMLRKSPEASCFRGARVGARSGAVMRRDPGPEAGQDGFAAVDALVAITILSLSLALSLTAAQAGVRASRAAGETRDAELILRDHLEQTDGRAGVWSGQGQGLVWHIEAHAAEITPAGKAGPCLRVASAKALRTGRLYRLATVDVCLPEANRPEAPPGGGA